VSKIGSIEAYVGPMFSGKSAVLADKVFTEINVLHRNALLFKPDIDNRGEGLTVVAPRARAPHEAIAIPTRKPEQIIKYVLQAEPPLALVAIDEAQFFPGKQRTSNVVREIARMGINLVWGGLQKDFKGDPFGATPELMAVSDSVIFLFAACTFILADNTYCGLDATRTQRIVDGKPALINSPQVIVGSNELYEARCPAHNFVTLLDGTVVKVR